MSTKLKTDKVSIPLFGHGLDAQGTIAHEPHVLGTFAEDPVTGSDGQEYGVFTVSDEAPNLAQWAGVYRVSVAALAAVSNKYFNILDAKYNGEGHGFADYTDPDYDPENTDPDYDPENNG